VNKTHSQRLLALWVILFVFALVPAPSAAEEAEVVEELNPLLIMPADDQFSAPYHPYEGTAAFFNDASLTLSSAYYGRARSADNKNRSVTRSDQNEIHVNAFGQRVDFVSGYAWGWLGMDVSGQTTLGKGRGWSEVLLHEEPQNIDRGSISLGQAALKTRFGDEQLGFEARGGYTPIRVGSLGTSGGLFSHAYRGFEGKFLLKGFQLGYGWADQFRNEWDNTFRDMTNSWGQGRYNDPAKRVSYIHSLGLRYEFGEDKAGFADFGVGEAHNFRRNMQGVVSVPFDLGEIGKLTLTAYGIAAKFRDKGLYNAGKPIRTEYHISGSATLKRGDWTYGVGMGHTKSLDMEEMSFRLASWGNCDNRNFIQTAGQLDDFVWDGQNVAMARIRYDIGEKIRLPGLSVGVVGFWSWNGGNSRFGGKCRSWEIDYSVEYAVQKGSLKGLAVGVYAGHLRYSGNNFHGKQNRDDVKLIVTYSKTFEEIFKRFKNS